MFYRIGILCVLSSLLLSYLNATVLHVPADYPSIQQAFEDSQDYDTVFVSNGIYYENISWPDKQGIKLIGEDKSETIIDGNASGRVIGILYQPYYLSEPWDTNTVIRNFTIRNGQNAMGAGISVGNSGPLLEDLIVRDNQGVVDYENRGIGISCFFAYPVLRDIDVFNNIVPEGQEGEYVFNGGAGVRCEDSNVTIQNIHIYENVIHGSGFGAGLKISYSTVFLSNSIISDNTLIPDSLSIQMGGGINCSFSDIYLSNVLIQNNTAIIAGGIDISQSTGSFSDVEISNNVGTASAGGIHASTSTLIFEEVHVDNNTAGHSGGGISALGTVEIRAHDSSVSGNSVEEGSGGGIDCSGGSPSDSLKLSGLVVNDNNSQFGGGIYIPSYSDAFFLEIERIQITNNTSFYGGGIYYSSLNNNNFIKNCTISGNIGFQYGGGIYLFSDGTTYLAVISYK